MLQTTLPVYLTERFKIKKKKNLARRFLPRQPIDHFNLPTIASSVYPIFVAIKFDDQTWVTGAESEDKT